jgi:light-regulated signal transduction histidine kinase (bacteriophytochrome)
MSMPDPFRVDDALLATCAAEPIHVPGAVQTHGLLLVLSPDLHVEQAAGAALLDLPPAALPGRDLAAHVSASLAGAVRASLPTLRSGAPRDLGTYLLNGVDLDVSLHRHEGLILLELIPRGTRAPGLGVTIDSGMVITELLDTLGRGELADLPIEALCAQVAERFRSFSGYDRVMVYRFDAEWNGEVVAEAGPEPDGRFLGLCFPASDIPPQARDLYLRLRLRVLADVAADPAPLYPTLHPRTGGPLDLTYAQLRALSPVHREYLGNMGVQATWRAVSGACSPATTIPHACPMRRHASWPRGWSPCSRPWSARTNSSSGHLVSAGPRPCSTRCGPACSRCRTSGRPSSIRPRASRRSWRPMASRW